MSTNEDAPFALTTARLVLRPPRDSMASAWTAYRNKNREHFAASGPRLDREIDDATSLQGIRSTVEQMTAGTSAVFWLFHRDDAGSPIVGDVSLTTIVRGVFRACYCGYRIDASFEGRGLMTEALEKVLAHAFDALEMHRVMANYMPTNERSGRVLRRLGFTVEVYARDYLFLDGAWRDHILASLVHDEPKMA